MIIFLQKLIALLPLLILGLTIVIIMFSIALRRNHTFSAVFSIFSLNIALISLFFVNQIVTINITPLMQVDRHAVFYTGLILLTSLASCVFAYLWLEGYRYNKEEFYILVLITSLGGIVLTNANHMISLFLGIELMSIPLFGLIGYTFQQKHSLEASIKYTVLSTIASSFILFGIAMFYAQSGDLSFTSFNNYLNNKLQEPLLSISLIFIIIGFSFKLSLVPFHLWTPDVYQGAPAPVSIFLTIVNKIAIFSVMMRFFPNISPYIEYKVIYKIIYVIAFTSIIFGNLMAFSQNNIKRLLSYSSISHLGYLLVALIAIQSKHQLAETAGIYLTSYFLSSLGAFGIISLMSSPYCGKDTDSLLSYRGLFWYRPILSVSMTIVMLSLAGIPITLGFIGKFYIFIVSIQSNLWWLITAMLIGSIISLYYYLQIIINLFLKTSQKLGSYRRHSWQYILGEIIILVSANLIIIFGIYPQPLIKIVRYSI